MVLAAAVTLAVLFSAVPKDAKAAGDPRPSLADMVSFSALNEWITRFSLMFVRSAVEFTYQDVTNDPYANTTSITGLVIRPDLPWDRGRNCFIRAERLTLSSAELGEWDRIGMRVELSGAVAPLACVPPDAAGLATVAEVDELKFDRLFLTIDYRLSSSSLRADLHLTMPGMAAVTADMDFAYVAIRDEGDDLVTLDLSYGVVTIEDLGLWDKAKKIMPPEMAQPEAVAQIVAAGLTDMFAEMNPRPAPNMPPKLNPAQAAFVQAAATEARAFAQKPGTIVVETGGGQIVRLNEQVLDDPGLLFAALQPTVGSRPAARKEMLAAALLSAGLNDPASLSDADKLRVGMALVSGDGVPRSPDQGRALLRPLADAGNGEAAVALAEALADDDPEAAYRYALQAGVDGVERAIGQMDRLEQNLTTPQVLEMQAGALAGAALAAGPDDFVPLAAVRENAMAHLRGRGAVRSYARAYYWALLGQAAKDGAATSLVAEIEARMRHRGEAAAEAWQAVAAQARADALALWLAADYPARLKGE